MKRKKPDRRQPAKDLSFEEALAHLEQVVQQLEDGSISLGEALDRYEQGVQYLKHCHHTLQKAERKIAMLSGVDEQGNPRTMPFDEQTMSLEEKADRRSRRRRRPGSAPPPQTDDRAVEESDDMDPEGRLF